MAGGAASWAWLVLALPLLGFALNGALALLRPDAKRAVSIIGVGVLFAAFAVALRVFLGLADAHVEENEATFTDEYLEPAYRDRRPRVAALDQRAVWVIDDRIFPQRMGRGAHTFATPPSIGAQLTALSASKPDTLPSMTLSDVGARISQMAAERLDLQVIYPTLFLIYLTDDVALEDRGDVRVRPGRG